MSSGTVLQRERQDREVESWDRNNSQELSPGKCPGCQGKDQVADMVEWGQSQARLLWAGKTQKSALDHFDLFPAAFNLPISLASQASVPTHTPLSRRPSLQLCLTDG